MRYSTVRFLTGAIVVLTTVAGCQGAAGGNVENSPGPPELVTQCTVGFGVTQVRRLVDAFNAGNRDAVRALLDQSSFASDGLEITPSLSSTADLGAIGLAHSHIQVHSESDLDAFMRDINGFHFRIAGSLSGSTGAGIDTRPGSPPAIAIGPVLWSATSRRVTQGGHDHIDGGGKAMVSCATGKFVRALFSPLRVV
jgi:hypothetical protein